MRIGNENYILNATLTATNEDDNYLVAAIKDIDLEDIFKTITSSSVITATFQEDKTIDVLGLSYHNLTSATYVLKDSGGSAVDSGSLEVDYDTNMTYIDSTVCRSVEITINSTTTCYLGGIYAGGYIDTLGININPEVTYDNNDADDYSDGGQASVSMTRPLYVINASLSNIDVSQKNELQGMITDAGGWKRLWVDLYPGSHEWVRPIHCLNKSRNSFPRISESNTFITRLSFKEVR